MECLTETCPGFIPEQTTFLLVCFNITELSLKMCKDYSNSEIPENVPKPKF